MGFLGFGKLFFPGFGFLIQIVLLILFLLVVYWVLKSGKFEIDSPKNILKKRLAKGEISKKEYKELLKEIEEE